MDITTLTATTIIRFATFHLKIRMVIKLKYDSKHIWFLAFEVDDVGTNKVSEK